MLTERQKKILWAIVDEYIISAEPVGSRTVSKKKGVGFSAATVRNEMADLEEMGFLEQPHTSAGRIPSEKGYRFYVDHLLHSYVPKEEDHDVFLLDQAEKLEQEMQRISARLSQLTNYMTMIASPKLVEGHLKHLSIVPITEQIAVSVIVSDKGQVEQHQIVIPEMISSSMIEELVNLLNYRAIGIPLSQLRKQALRQINDDLHHLLYPKPLISTMLEQLFMFEQPEQLFLSGTTRMLEQPEFRDVDKVRSLLDLVEANEQVLQLLEPIEPMFTGVQVRIGSEIAVEGVEGCSVITASFELENDPVGTIGVLGPTRMDYGKVISLIEGFTKSLSNRN
ncbi:heat-inducible transcriptional repressor HrcA [Shimazuella alba]|jgi:heat-inducible transcriptional repressor|uniref:Heat-inducible transcription repressor HrcA n=1 Tax=Shimazuella alba TaxID=2690964 RepID=A0A6I4VTU6_9BACL|nr:heat-inducible transcriptional repressor HrcA [Shimazuella alba]MXQ53595.1 heat-inducible transcription repressor HrcA [Shimazuella alba]